MRSYVLPAITISMLAAASTMALAADLPSRRAPPVFAPPPIPVFTWTGFFAGGNVGANFDTRRNTTFAVPAGSIAGSTGSAGTLTTNGPNNDVGFTGGGQIGYNYELGGAGFGGLGGLGFGGGGLVIGVVADAQYLDERNNNNPTYSFAPNSPLTVGNAFVNVPGLGKTNLVSTHPDSKFFGTVRGRLGVAFDRLMVYGTGGFAYNTHTDGYAVGGGVEYSLTNNISVGAEYLYVDLNKGLNSTLSYVPARGIGPGTLFLNTTGGRDTFNVARFFVNYRFNVLQPAPIVARY